MARDGGPPLLAIVGPTAVGKTALAARLAQRLPLEVVSADSRQIYRRLDIGTAKPSAEELRAVRHHLVDVVEPNDTLTLAQYQELALTAIDNIHARGRLPALVGGTGLYIWSVLENWDIPRVPPQMELRAQLETEAEAQGADTLHRRLAELDPAAAVNIHPHNVRRVIRALEVCLATGQPISHQQRRRPSPYAATVLGLTADRAWLHGVADARVERMFAAGLICEVFSLLKASIPATAPSMSGIGYRQVVDHLSGAYDEAEAVRRTITATHRLIRQQGTWFRRDDERIAWFDAQAEPEGVASQVGGWLERRI